MIESAPLYSNLTASENLIVRTTALGLPKTRIDEVLQIVGLTDTGKKKARQFSMSEGNIATLFHIANTRKTILEG